MGAQPEATMAATTICFRANHSIALTIFLNNPILTPWVECNVVRWGDIFVQWLCMPSRRFASLQVMLWKWILRAAGEIEVSAWIAMLLVLCSTTSTCWTRLRMGRGQETLAFATKPFEQLFILSLWLRRLVFSSSNCNIATIVFDLYFIFLRKTQTHIYLQVPVKRLLANCELSTDEVVRCFRRFEEISVWLET